MTSATPAPLAFGKLVVTNVVTTYTVRVADKKDKVGELNLPAVALVGKGNYGRSFPAVVNKGQAALSYREEERIDDDAFWFPLIRQLKNTNLALSKIAKLRIKADIPVHAASLSKSTNAMFKTGSTVVAGGTTVNENRFMAYNYIRRQNHDQKLTWRIFNMVVQNIVSCTDLGFEINCDWINTDAENKGLRVAFSPEDFTGLSWVSTENNLTIVFVIFASGKVIATSMTKMEHAPIAEERIQRLIVPYRKGNEPADYVPVHHMRDRELLSKIRVPGDKSSARANANDRSHKKLNAQVQALMKHMSCNDVSDLDDVQQVVLARDSFNDVFLSNIPE